MTISRGQTLILFFLFLSACNTPGNQHQGAPPKITVATVQSKAVTLTQQYICRIQPHHQIKIRALAIGYLDAIEVKEGQAVKRGDVLFVIDYKKLYADENKVVSQGDVSPLDNKLTEAKANAEPAAVKLGKFAIKAPFDGTVGLLPYTQGTLLKKDDTLTTLSDDSQMWAYFNVPEATYLEFKAAKLDQHKEDLKIELLLADGKKFDQPGKLGAIGANFDSDTGTIRFRADFPNRDHRLHHGQTGTVLIGRVLNDAIAIPQQATLEVMGKRYVYVVDDNDVAHQREIIVQNEVEDEFVIKTGLSVGDKIVIEGVRLIRSGEKVRYKEQVAGDRTNHGSKN